MRWALAPLVIAVGCASTPQSVQLGDWMRVGVDPVDEAARVEEALRGAGWETAQRLEGEGYVALGLVRGEQRAVRVVTSRGVAAALDSHEPDGVRSRHGLVRLAETEPDLDGDGAPEVVVVRAGDDGDCLAVLRLDDDGRLALAPDDAEALQPGSCVGELRDVDGDGTPEALARLRWPELALDDEVPALFAALVLEEGAWRARGVPSAYLEVERAAREEALAAARAARVLPTSLRLAVELTALAHLSGATVATQVERFDAAMSGLVLTELARARVAEVRAVIATGWGARRDPAMTRGPPDEQEGQSAGRAAGLPQPEGDQDP